MAVAAQTLSAEKGSKALFFIQLFATLSYSVLYSTLLLYITQKLHFSDIQATEITSSFIAFNYALHLVGGYIGGRFLSYRMLFVVGMILETIGCALIAIPTVSVLFWGLAIFLAGAGVNVTCINCMLTQLYEPGDNRRETAFLWNYSGMNIGFFIGFSLSGYFQVLANFHDLFLISATGNILALLICLKYWSHLGDRYTSLVHRTSTQLWIEGIKGITAVTLLALALCFLLKDAAFSNHLIMVVGAIVAVVVSYIAYSQPTPVASKKLWGYFILALYSVVFWALYQMAPMSLTLFIERNVNCHVLGLVISPQWVQNINTFCIVVGGPILAQMFQRLRQRGINISIPLQFAAALILIGLGYAILPIGIACADSHGFVNFNWIVANFVLQSIGELFISPIGYAMIGQLVPGKLQGFFMGVWLMITGVAATLSGYFSKLAVGTSNQTNPILTNPGYSHSFGFLGLCSMFMGLLLLLMIPFVRKLITPEPEHEIPSATSRDMPVMENLSNV